MAFADVVTLLRLILVSKIRLQQPNILKRRSYAFQLSAVVLLSKPETPGSLPGLPAIWRPKKEDRNSSHTCSILCRHIHSLREKKHRCPKKHSHPHLVDSYRSQGNHYVSEYQLMVSKPLGNLKRNIQIVKKACSPRHYTYEANVCSPGMS